MALYNTSSVDKVLKICFIDYFNTDQLIELKNQGDDDDYDRYYNENKIYTYEFNKKVWELYRIGDNSLAPSLCKSLIINFNDEPPMSLNRFHLVESDEHVIGSLDVVDNKWELNFLNKPTTHTFKCRLLTYKLEYRITCGTISEVITEEEYNNLIDTYENNNLRLRKESDQAKINERLKDYDR